jgi:parallel beta-helix repeat protein
MPLFEGRSRLESKRPTGKREKEMEKRTRRRLALFGVLLWPLSAAGRTAPASQTATVPQGWALVDCGKEDAGALQRAIDRARPGDTILVSGTCHENLTVHAGKDQITLDGGGTAIIDGPDATLNTISARGVRDIRVTGFTITGGRAGISIDRGASALVDGNTIDHAGRFGIIVGGWSTANIINNTIQNNPTHGINVTGNSFVFIGFRTADDTVASPNTIRDNGVHGINVTFSSSARIAGNAISNNLRNGINIERASQATVSDNDLDGNGQNGIFVTENGGANLGSDTGAGIFEAPNRTSVNNGVRGISCRVGGYANGRIGTLNGSAGQKSFGSSCIDSLDQADTF